MWLDPQCNYLVVPLRMLLLDDIQIKLFVLHKSKASVIYLTHMYMSYYETLEFHIRKYMQEVKSITMVQTNLDVFEFSIE
jgi:hypothetical protein